MNVQINDCTIRDGGYVLDKNPDPEYVRAVFAALLDSGIDVTEIGFLQRNVTGESVVYGNSIDAGRLVPRQNCSSRFTGFCDNSRFSLDLLDEHGSGAFDYLKISFAKHECDSALDFVAGAAAKGYKVFCNPMDAPSYSMEERSEMIAKVNIIKPYCFSIVDTFGTMYLDDIERVFLQVDEELDRSIRIGLHSHNNLQLSNALAERMIDLASESNRDIVVDASLYGMGRGAGNASTEVIASFLNKKYGYKYNMECLMDAIDTHIAPLCGTTRWGYDLSFLTCGTLGAHVDNIKHMDVLADYSSFEQYQILSSLDPDQRKRYGPGYSKNDFTLLDNAISKLAKE